MTLAEELYLSDNLRLFEKDLDRAIERICNCKQDASFYSLYALLVQKLFSNPLVSAHLGQLEEPLKIQQDKRNKEDWKLLEEYWIKLWRCSCGLKLRKQLVWIKQLRMFRDTIMPLIPIKDLSLLSYIEEHSFVYRVVHDSMLKFALDSPMRKLSSLLKKAFVGDNSNTRGFEVSDIVHEPPRQITVRLLQLDHGDKKKSLCQKISYSQRSVAIKKMVKIIPTDFLEIPVVVIPSCIRNGSLQSDAEISPAICWGRMQLLRQCYTMQELTSFKEVKGRWNLIRDKVYQDVLARSNVLVLLGVRNTLYRIIGRSFSKVVDQFTPDDQICRENFEEYLRELGQHLKGFLARKESEKTLKGQVPDQLPLTIPQQKLEELIKHTKTFWAIHPDANHETVYLDYHKNSKLQNSYTFEGWSNLVRKYKLDPRPSDKKTRGKGKKGL